MPPGGGYENPGHRRARGGFGENGAGAAGPVTLLLSFPFQAPSAVIHRDSGSQQQGESGCDALVTVIKAVVVN